MSINSFSTYKKIIKQCTKTNFIIFCFVVNLTFSPYDTTRCKHLLLQINGTVFTYVHFKSLYKRTVSFVLCISRYQIKKSASRHLLCVLKLKILCLKLQLNVYLHTKLTRPLYTDYSQSTGTAFLQNIGSYSLQFVSPNIIITLFVYLILLFNLLPAIKHVTAHVIYYTGS